MPELPEVETIARGLNRVLATRRILEVHILGPHAVGQGAKLFTQRVSGARVTGVGRRGKLLLLWLDSPASNAPLVLSVHLRMTGRLFLPTRGTGADLEHSPHTHVLLRLEDLDAPLLFHDVRKFGRLLALTEEELAAWPFWAGLGPEPLEVDSDGFVDIFKGRRGRVKALLLDQKRIAGIGNIYADESLFRAGIRPDAPAGNVSRQRLRRLHRELQEVLREAIDACGSSISDYRTASGDAGAFQNRFRVYGRGGEECQLCGATLRKITVAGRTSVFCPKCQS